MNRYYVCMHACSLQYDLIITIDMRVEYAIAIYINVLCKDCVCVMFMKAQKARLC